MSDDIFNFSKFYVDTPMVEAFKEKIQNWLWNGYLGGYIIGNSRAGKSTAIRYISGRIMNRYGEIIPVHRVTIPKRDKFTVASVFKNICYSLNMKLKPRATSNEMANDLIHYFAELAHTNKSKQVVIIVDEMQRLKINQIEAFNELHDSLADLNLNLSVFFVGNSKTSLSLLNQIKTPECDHIWGRFFKYEYKFHGIKSHSEVEQILGEYDKKYTKQFLPEYFEAGWRLKSISHLIWDVYRENYKSKFTIQSWGMQYFTAMVRVLLVDYLPNYGVDNQGQLNAMINRSIEASGLVEELVRINND